MKDKLSNKLGTLGYVLFFGLSVVFTFAPLLVLQLPFWADLLIIAGVSLLPIIGTIVNLGIWGWAATIAWNEPLSWNLVFWVVLALDILFYLFPLLSLLFVKLGALAEKIKSSKYPPAIDTYETYLVCPSCGSLAHKGEDCSCGYHFAPESRPFWRRKSVLAVLACFILAIGIFTGSYGGYSVGCEDGYNNGKSAAYEEYYNLGFNNGKKIADRDLEALQNEYDRLHSDIYSYLSDPSQEMPLRLRLLMMLENPEKESDREYGSQYYGGEKYEPSSESSPNQKQGASEYLKQKAKESMDRIDKEYGSQYYGGSEYKPDS